jgi:hypothetical protein
MSSNKLKYYTLFTGAFGAPIYNKTADYNNTMMVVRVSAYSIKQAYYLCSKQVWKTDLKEPGITRVDTNTGSKTWKEV